MTVSRGRKVHDNVCEFDTGPLSCGCASRSCAGDAIQLFGCWERYPWDREYLCMGRCAAGCHSAQRVISGWEMEEISPDALVGIFGLLARAMVADLAIAHHVPGEQSVF